MNNNLNTAEKPLVSVIMGVYNGEKSIKRAAESILFQTYENIEFIICDDCSSDNTKTILKELQSTDSRVILLNNETNMGLSVSLNKCPKVNILQGWMMMIIHIQAG